MYTDDENVNQTIKLTACRVVNNQLIHASVATKEDGPFYCPDYYWTKQII